MKEIYNAYLKLSLALKVFTNEGFIPFDILKEFEFTFIFRKNTVKKDLLEWLEIIFSDKEKISDFYVSIQNREKDVDEKFFYKNNIFPVLVFQKGKLHSTWKIKKAKTEKSFIIYETEGWADKIDFDKNALSNKLKSLHYDIPQFKHAAELLYDSDYLLNEDLKKIEHISIKNLLGKSSIASICALVELINYFEENKNSNDKQIFELYKLFIMNFCTTMSYCVSNVNQLRIRNIYETMLYVCATCKDISKEESKKNIFEAIKHIKDFYILVDKETLKIENNSSCAKPLVSYTNNGSPRIWIATTLDTTYTAKFIFDNDDLVFTYAPIEKIKKLCSLVELESTFYFYILLPNDVKIQIKPETFKKYLEEGQNEKNILDDSQKLNIKDIDKEQSILKRNPFINKRNRKFAKVTSIVLFVVLSLFFTYPLWRSDYILEKYEYNKKTLKEYRGKSKEVYINSYRLNLKAISGFAFNKTALEKVKIGGGVTILLENSFQYSLLSEIILPYTLEKIEKDAFAYMCNLKEIEIPTSVYEIEDCFQGTNIEKITIGKNLYERNKDHLPDVEYIFKDDSETFDTEKYVNYRKTNNNELYLVSCTIPYTEDIYIKEGTKYLDSFSFLNSKARFVYIPDSITLLESFTFSNSEIEDVRLSENLKTIKNHAFSNCKNLKSIKIPDSVTEIGENIFVNCSNLKKVELGKGLKDLSSGTFFCCDSLEEIFIPKNIERIQSYTFPSNCTSLKTIILESKNTIIEENAFDYWKTRLIIAEDSK